MSPDSEPVAIPVNDNDHSDFFVGNRVGMVADWRFGWPFERDEAFSTPERSDMDQEVRRVFLEGIGIQPEHPRFDILESSKLQLSGRGHPVGKSLPIHH